MDYEKAYKDALNKVKSRMKNSVGGCLYEGDIKEIFPELAESEDEKIRKEIIKLVKYYYGSSLALKHAVSNDEMVTWLEKQKEFMVKPFSIEKNKYYYCIKDFFSGGNKEVSKGDVVLALSGMRIMSLSNEEAAEYFIPVNSIIDLRMNQEIKQEFKHKFDSGNWITNGEVTFKIDKVFATNYIDTAGAVYNIEHTDANYHLWTIEDAKDGDILVCDFLDCIHFTYIYKEKYNCGIESHCFWDNIINKFQKGTPQNRFTFGTPATIVQRINFFQEMHAAGYEWDAKNKELVKK